MWALLLHFFLPPVRKFFTFFRYLEPLSQFQCKFTQSTISKRYSSLLKKRSYPFLIVGYCKIVKTLTAFEDFLLYNYLIQYNWHCQKALSTTALFGGVTSQSRIFHSYGYVTIMGEELQILTYTRYSWSLNN